MENDKSKDKDEGHPKVPKKSQHKDEGHPKVPKKSQHKDEGHPKVPKKPQHKLKRYPQVPNRLQRGEKGYPKVPNKSLRQLDCRVEKAFFIPDYPRDDKPMIDIVKQMLRDPANLDITIRIGNWEFSCFLAILQIGSKLFENIVNVHFIDLSPESIEPLGFMLAYNWITAKVPVVRREYILEVLRAAKYLIIPELETQCWALIDSELIKEDSAAMMFLEARLYNYVVVQELVSNRISRFFFVFVSFKEYLDLRIEEILIFLKSNFVGINKELEILFAAIRWLNHKYAAREKYIDVLTDTVRFKLMTPPELAYLLNNSDCDVVDRFVKRPEIVIKITQAFTFLSCKSNLNEGPTFEAPTNRVWVIDPTCSYHHYNNCIKHQYVAYADFREYLKLAHTTWEEIKYQKKGDKDGIVCSECGKCNKCHP